MNKLKININSEIGKLETVLVHTPGKEVENVTPANAERALYSDILNLTVAEMEYDYFVKILRKYSNVLEVKELLIDILRNEESKLKLVNKICGNEQAGCSNYLVNELSPEELASQLIEGVPIRKDNLTNFISRNRYRLQPLHNFFYMRDSSISLNDDALIARMASKVRERETIIMQAIFSEHPMFSANLIKPATELNGGRVTIEGGDVIVASEKIILIGFGARTTTQGIDFLINYFKSKRIEKHIIAQELPRSPESFIHLDMVFTILDNDVCMIYKPVIMNHHSFQTVHIHIDNGRVKSISEEQDMISVLKKLGMELQPVICGGDNEEIVQEREQWHSGANYFALAPGKVMGYGRNLHTNEALNNMGFEIIGSEDILSGKAEINDYRKCVIAVPGAELSRGGGGCRCMTMPLSRENL